MASFDDVQISLAPPRLLIAYTLLLHIFTALLLMTVQPLWLALICVLLVLVNAVYELGKVRRGPRVVACVANLDKGSEWRLDDDWRGALLDVPCATRWLIVMRLVRAEDGARRWLVFAGDQLHDADARRLLRVLKRTAG